MLVILGLIFNRFNVSMLALEMRPGYVYYPHWMELAISLGLVVWALIFFQIAVRLLPLIHLGEKATRDSGRMAPDNRVSAGVVDTQTG